MQIIAIHAWLSCLIQKLSGIFCHEWFIQNECILLVDISVRQTFIIRIWMNKEFFLKDLHWLHIVVNLNNHHFILDHPGLPPDSNISEFNIRIHLLTHWKSSRKEWPTLLFFWLNGTPRSGDSYDLHLNEA